MNCFWKKFSLFCTGKDGDKGERDVQVTGVRRWREFVIDREKLRGIV